MRSLPNPREPFLRVPTLGRDDVRLFLVSSTLLFTELLLIRWIPANVRYVGFFSNFLLMASFLGIGLGIMLGRSGRLPFFSPFGPLLLATLLLVINVQLNVKVSDAQEIFYGLAENPSANVNFLVLPLVVALTAALMASLALPLGPLLRSMPPLRAYAIDISGSMVGIAGFAALAALATGPLAWFAVVAILVLLQGLGRGISGWSLVGGASLALVIAIVGYHAVTDKQLWSPYYRISTFYHGAPVSAAPGSTDYPRDIFVDGIPHQNMVTAAEAVGSPLHSQVYTWFPDRRFDRVLIIGAGSGTDTTLAVTKGAGFIDAVEIDPEIGRIGREFQPDHVFQNPAVHQHINDGRAFLRNTTAQYDLVVFALTDSLTLVSSTANVRLESFLYTEEALASARDHLTPDGVFVMYNFYRDPWLVSKLKTMMTDVFASEPLVRLGDVNDAVLADGPGVTALKASGASSATSDPVPPVGDPAPTPATDDWPFLYLRVPTIAPYYLATLGFLLLLAGVSVFSAARITRVPVRRFSPHFFVLGVAFLLLETKSIVSFSLLFGTTWLVNALAFFAILASVLLAILVTRWIRLTNPALLYVGLFAAILVAFLLPPEELLIDPPQLRYALAAIVAFAPVFFANLVFAYSFKDTATADMSFASNLLGAMVGGALEYLALLTGFRALLIVVALLYALAYLLAVRWRVLADVDLVAEPSAA